jgi:hypothetical protein
MTNPAADDPPFIRPPARVFHMVGTGTTALALPLMKARSCPMHKEEGRTVETPVESRQGFLDRPVLAVLVVSVALVLILYGFIYFGFFGTS